MNTNILREIVQAAKEPPQAPLQTQSEKAREKTEPDPTPQSTAFINARNFNARDRYSQGPRKPYPPGTKAPDFTNAALTAAQISLSGPPLCSEEELNSLRNAEVRMTEILAEMERFSTNAADQAHDSQADETLRAVMAGEKTPAHRSRASFQAEFRAEQSARMHILRQVTHEIVVPIARAILHRFTERADELLRFIEEGDQHLCASYGLEYKPSVVWQAVANVSEQYLPEMRLPRPTMYASPRMILQGIVDL